MGSMVTLYCNQRHRLSDGEPIAHHCRIVPPECLKAEQEDDIERYVKELERKPFVLSNGIPEEAGDLPYVIEEA